MNKTSAVLLFILGMALGCSQERSAPLQRKDLPRIVEMRIINKDTVFFKSEGESLSHLGKNGGLIEDNYFINVDTGEVLKKPDAHFDEATFSVGESCSMGRDRSLQNFLLLRIEDGRAVFKYTKYAESGLEKIEEIISIKPYGMAQK